MSLMRWFYEKLELKYGSRDLYNEIHAARSGSTKSGVNVNWSNALEVTTVFACARVLAEGIAQVPFRVMVRKGRDNVPAEDHPLFELISRRPNSYQTSYEFRETMMLHLVLTGNCFVFKGMVGSRRELRELVLLDPSKVQVKMNGERISRYEYTNSEGVVVSFDPSFVWHVRGPSWNTYLGLDAVRMAREAIGLAMSTESAHSALHKGGVRVSGTYSVEGNLSVDKYKTIMAFLEKRMQGGEDQGKPLILDQGAKWLQHQMSGVDTQHLETRNHQIEEICSAMRVWPIMIGHAEKSMISSSTEQLFIAHVVHSLTPYYTRIEQSAETFLLTQDELKKGYSIKFFPNALMRGSAQARSEFYKSAIGSVNATPGWMTINEIRALEELPAKEEGDVLFVPTSTPATAPQELPPKEE